MHKGAHLRLTTKESVVINTCHEGKELGNWVTQYAPTEFKLTYLPFSIFLEVMEDMKLLIKC